jgi:hypothetical protein
VRTTWQISPFFWISQEVILTIDNILHGPENFARESTFHPFTIMLALQRWRDILDLHKTSVECAENIANDWTKDHKRCNNNNGYQNKD